MTLRELIMAYQSGELTAPLVVDNDELYVYTPDGKQFSMHPDEFVDAALTLLGIPHENV